MLRATRFTGSLESRMPAIARRVRNRIGRLNIREVELARCCRELAPSVLGAELRVSCDRVSKILMNCKRNPGRNAAKVISYQELQVLAAALGVSME